MNYLSILSIKFIPLQALHGDSEEQKIIIQALKDLQSAREKYEDGIRTLNSLEVMEEQIHVKDQGIQDCLNGWKIHLNVQKCLYNVFDLSTENLEIKQESLEEVQKNTVG